MKRVAVVILNWNGEKLLRQFLPSVLRNTSPELGRVIVADNHSTDDSLEVLKREFPEAEVLILEENYGFAGGYNRAIAQIEAEIVVLLNSDVEVGEQWLEPLVALLDREPATAAVQPKIKSWKEKERFEYAGACGGYIDRYGFPFCRGRILDHTETDEGQYDTIREVFWCSGAAFCIRRDVYLQCGGLDENFFAHMEEIDLCWRLRNRGYALKVNPASVVYHLGGGSLPMDHPKKLFLNYRNNWVMMYKNQSAGDRWKILFIRRLLDGGAWVMFVLKGRWNHAGSLVSAYRSYRKMKKKYKSGGGKKGNSCMYKGSIVVAAWVYGKKTFRDLNPKKFLE